MESPDGRPLHAPPHLNLYTAFVSEHENIHTSNFSMAKYSALFSDTYPPTHAPTHTRPLPSTPHPPPTTVPGYALTS